MKSLIELDVLGLLYDYELRSVTLFWTLAKILL